MYLEETANKIVDYISDSRYKQAILINGAWGVGKTYFVKNTLIPKLSQYRVIWYSLYGVCSSDQVKSDLQREIIITAIQQSNFIKEKKIKIPTSLINIAPNAIDIILKKLGFEKNDLSTILDEINIDTSKIIIIFDDLERSNIDINEALGTINSYVEIQKIKVIVIANENEIGSSRISSDLPEKFLVASNPTIDLIEQNDEGKTTKEDHNTVKDNKKTRYSYEDLIKRSKILFSNDIVYNSIKEKLIGLTVTINTNFHELYDNIIDINAIVSKEFLKSNKDSVIDVLESTDCHNLRTFVFGIITFDKIYDIIKKLSFDDIENDYQYLVDKELVDIMRYVIYFSVKYKSGRIIDRNDTDSFSSAYTFLVKGVKEYNFVNKYICYHEIDPVKVKDELYSIVSKKIKQIKDEKEKDSLSFYKLTSFEWAYLHDNQVIELSNKLYDELVDNKYEVRFFKSIVYYLLQIKYNFSEKRDKIQHNDEQYIEVMVNYIKSHKNKANQLDLLESESDDKPYKELILPLIKATVENEDNAIKKSLKDLFGGSNWASEFYQYCRDYRDDFLQSRRFLSSFDISLLKNALLKATNEEFRDSLRAICSVYDFNNIYEFFQTDIPDLEEIIILLENKYNDEKTECTTKIVLKSYIDKLISRLKLLKQNN